MCLFGVFLWNCSQKSSDFIRKVRVLSNLKSGGGLVPDFFGKKRPKMTIFKFYEKVMCGIFFNFLMLKSLNGLKCVCGLMH